MAHPATLTLVRHGETSANLDGVWHGSTDTALTPRGREQAQRVAQYLATHRADAVALYTSPLTRTLDTARAIGQAMGLEPRPEADLREYGLGAWEGRSYREIAEKEQFWQRMKSDPEFAPPGGETPVAVRDRLVRALEQIDAAHAGERAIVVTHGGALSMVLGDLLDGDYTVWSRIMSNCAVSELQLRPQPHLIDFNLTDHLEGL